MNFLLGFVVVLHVIVCFFLIGVVLLQQGRSADLAGAFGGQGSQTAFGPRAAANVLTRLTTWSAIIFMCTSITLTILYQRSSTGSSVLENPPSQRPPSPASSQQTFYFHSDIQQRQTTWPAVVASAAYSTIFFLKILLTIISDRYILQLYEEQPNRLRHPRLALHRSRISPATRFTRPSKTTSAASGARATGKSTPPSSGWPPKA
jgi:preprotein translocase subunit SecG